MPKKDNYVAEALARLTIANRKPTIQAITTAYALEKQAREDGLYGFYDVLALPAIVYPDATPKPLSLSPATGTLSTFLTVLGSFFTGTTLVTINGVSCSSIVVVNDGKITCYAPSVPVGGPYALTITTPLGTGTLTAAYTAT